MAFLFLVYSQGGGGGGKGDSSVPCSINGLTPHALRADGHAAEWVTINVIIKHVLFYDDVSD